jgi:hypothetical protein
VITFLAILTACTVAYALFAMCVLSAAADRAMGRREDER